jgi:uncharacterized membrane protein YeaQ/YmgE (transglycosylase-associated protein family)
MIFALFGTIFLAIIIGYFSERTGFTHNGYLNSIIICVGGAVLFILIRFMFGFSFGSHGTNTIISSIGALIIVPTHFRRK